MTSALKIFKKPPLFLKVLLAGFLLFPLTISTGWTAESKNVPVRSASEMDYPPYCIVRADGQVDGFSVELLRAALKAMGRDVTFKTGLWHEVKKDLADGRIQVLPLVGRTPEREGLFDFTFPYLTMHGAIVVRQDTKNIATMADLKGKRVAVLRGDNAEEYLRRSGSKTVILPRPSFEVALRELSAGKHDAVVIQKLVAFQIMQQAGLKNLRTVGPPLRDFVQEFCFAVRKGDHKLLATLNEGLSIVIADGTFRHLHAKWFSSLEAIGRTRSRIIVGGDSDYPPYEYLDRNGQPAGFNVDLTKAIARRTGLTVEIRLGPWKKIRQGLENGEIDAVQGMFYTPERDRDFDFSPPSTMIQHAIVFRNGSPKLSDMKDLAGKSILVMAGDLMEDLAIKLGYQKQLVPVPSQEEALRLLAAGRHDCALVARIPALFWIEKYQWRNLTVSDTPVLAAEYCYAVSKDKQALLSQLSEGLAGLKTTGEYRKIRDTWLSPYETAGVSSRAFVKYILMVTVPLVALLVGSLLWSRSLRRQVANRTRELTDEVAKRVRASDELRQAKELAEASNRTKSVFLANMSHELRTPLNAILGFSNLLCTDASITDEHRNTLNIINNSGRHLLQLINDVLDMAKIESGRIVLEETVFDLWQMVRDVVNLMEMRAREKGLFLTLDQSSAFPRIIRSDIVKLRQMLINLVGNALKFTDHGGVTLRLDVRHGDGPERLLLLIEVEDTGCGIAPEDHERIFEPFVQVAAQATQKGTGLGLTITRQFVELMGGEIIVKSIPGAGSKFRIAVPVGRANKSEISVAAAMRGRLVGMADDQTEIRVLIVEDEIDNRLLLQRLLAQTGFQVRHVTDGAAAVDAFKTWRPHFIWMDIHMPGMDGFEATRRIRELPGGKDVKIVACTASVIFIERDECLAAGMDGIIRKPYCSDELFDCMARQLSVRFIYDDALVSPALSLSPTKILRPEAIAVLPVELRLELTDVVVSLDRDRIAELVTRISEIEPDLGSTLAHYAEELNYTEIIRALQACKDIQDRETL